MLIGLAFLLSFLSGVVVRYLPLDYLLLIVGGLVFTYLVIAKIEIAIILSLFIQNQLARYNYLGNGTPYHPNGLMGIMLIAGAVIYFLFHKIDVSRFRAIGGFFAFTTVSMLSLLISRAYFMEGVGVTLRLFAAMAIYAILVYKLDSIAKIKWIIAAIIAAQIIPTISGLFMYAGQTGLFFTDETMRLGNSGVGVYLAEITALCLVFFMDSQRMSLTLLFGGLTALFGAGLFFSFGRSGWLGFLFAVVIIGLMRRRWILFVLPILLVLVVLFVPAIGQRFSDVLSSDHTAVTSSTFADRVGYWQAALEVYPNHLLGVGFGKGRYYVGEYRGTAPNMIHNDYISVLLDTGLIGLCVFILWQIQWVRALFSTYRNASSGFDQTFSMAVFTIFVASLLMRITDNIMLDSYDMYPICALVAAALAIPRIRNTPVSDPRSSRLAVGKHESIGTQVA